MASLLDSNAACDIVCDITGNGAREERRQRFIDGEFPMADGTHAQEQRAKRKRRDEALERLRSGPKTCELSHLDYAVKCLQKCGWEVEVTDDGTHYRAYTLRAQADGVWHSRVATVCTNPKGDHLLPIYVRSFLKEVQALLDVESGATGDGD